MDREIFDGIISFKECLAEIKETVIAIENSGIIDWKIYTDKDLLNALVIFTHVSSVVLEMELKEKWLPEELVGKSLYDYWASIRQLMSKHLGKKAETII